MIQGLENVANVGPTERVSDPGFGSIKKDTWTQRDPRLGPQQLCNFNVLPRVGPRRTQRQVCQGIRGPRGPAPYRAGSWVRASKR